MILVMIRENTTVVKMRRTDIKIESFNLILSKIAGIKGTLWLLVFYPVFSHPVKEGRPGDAEDFGRLDFIPLLHS